MGKGVFCRKDTVSNSPEAANMIVKIQIFFNQNRPSHKIFIELMMYIFYDWQKAENI